MTRLKSNLHRTNRDLGPDFNGQLLPSVAFSLQLQLLIL